MKTCGKSLSFRERVEQLAKCPDEEQFSQKCKRCVFRKSAILQAVREFGKLAMDECADLEQQCEKANKLERALGAEYCEERIRAALAELERSSHELIREDCTNCSKRRRLAC